MDQNKLKQHAAQKACEFIKSGMIIGIGTGSTVKFAIERIAELVKEEKLSNMTFFSTSEASTKLVILIDT